MADIEDLRGQFVVDSSLHSWEELFFCSREMPVSHRSSRPVELAASLASNDPLTPREGARVRADLETGDCVFFWIGSCAYPEPGMVLVWESWFDERIAQGALAAPWDTGGLRRKTLGTKISVSGARSLLDRFSLPPPTFREFLALVIGTSFTSANDYVAGVKPSGTSYPGWDMANLANYSGPASHTFELRVPGETNLLPDLVGVVVDERRFAERPQDLRALQGFLRSQEVDYVTPGFGDTTDQAAKDFVLDFLRARGAL